jgi:hypothetical protein
MQLTNGIACYITNCIRIFNSQFWTTFNRILCPKSNYIPWAMKAKNKLWRHRVGDILLKVHIKYTWTARCLNQYYKCNIYSDVSICNYIPWTSSVLYEEVSSGYYPTILPLQALCILLSLDGVYNYSLKMAF